MSAYESLAVSYDRLTNDVPYQMILDFAQSLLQERGVQPRSVLDLACGTGSLSVLLAQSGYRVIGVDMSEEMLTVAYDKASCLPDNRPFFVRQRMERLCLPEKVDFVICCLDSINYLTNPSHCRETFRRVYGSLNPGGVFLFDVNTPEKLRAMDGQVFLDEDEDVYCVWRGAFDEAERTCSYGMDIFQRRGKLWSRSQEEHREYAYELEELQDYLAQAGFRDVTLYGDLRREEPASGEQRVYFLAVKGDGKHE